VPRVGIKGQQKTYPVTVLCKVMAVSTSAYYDWAKQPTDTGKIAEKQKLRERAQALFNASKRSYGSRRLSDGLKKAGFPVSRYKTRRVMAELNFRITLFLGYFKVCVRFSVATSVKSQTPYF